MRKYITRGISVDFFSCRAVSTKSSARCLTVLWVFDADRLYAPLSYPRHRWAISRSFQTPIVATPARYWHCPEQIQRCGLIRGHPWTRKISSSHAVLPFFFGPVLVRPPSAPVRVIVRFGERVVK